MTCKECDKWNLSISTPHLRNGYYEHIEFEIWNSLNYIMVQKHDISNLNKLKKE